MKKNLTSWITIVVFFGCLLAVFALSFLLPDHDLSMTENRALAQRPVHDLSDLSAITQGYTDYVVDQFPARERLLKAYTALELAQGKILIRDTYRAAGDFLMPKAYAIDGEVYFSWGLENAVQKHPNVQFVYALLPTKGYLLSGTSPYSDGSIDAANREAMLTALSRVNGLEHLDISGDLRSSYTLEERQAMYYKTDFHWNSYGAFLAAERIGEALETRGLLHGAEAPTAEDFLWQELGSDHIYHGDLNRRFSYLLPTQEDIPHYTLRDTSQIRYFSGVTSEPVARNTILGTELEQNALSYNGISTFNLGYYRVENPNARSDQHVLILKDSYQNPTTDYFTELFAQVTVVDPRYYTESLSFQELLAQEEIDLVLFLYHQSNVSTELTDFLAAQ